MNVNDYLTRIGVGPGRLSVNAETLSHLHRQHLLHVPFENLDIHWKRPIEINTTKFYQKIVTEKRGGFCYELNGLFNELLVSLGFRTRLLSARVFNGVGHGPEFDHVTIVVTLGREEYLADVGFGDFSAEPLRYELDKVHEDSAGHCTLRGFDDDYLETAKLRDGEWKSEFIFRDVSCDLSEFSDMCDFQQYSPESGFTKGKVCTILTERGRKTLTDRNFVVTENGQRSELPVRSDEEFERILEREFGILAPSRALG